ncbi:MAG: DUF2306 domain-containing protein [Thalassovita sp.]
MLFRPQVTIPVALITLSLIPIAAGLARLAQIAGAPFEMPHNPSVSIGARTVLVVHIASALTFVSLGAFQFSAAPCPPNWSVHRLRGRIAGIAALATGASALWLTAFFPHAPHDGPALNILRVLAGAAIVATTVLGFWAIRTQRRVEHRKWMMRAYALGAATGLQSFATIGWHLAFENPSGPTRALIFGGCWCACLTFAEFRLRQSSRQKKEIP